MQPIYLDHAATTPLREEVVAAMEPHLQGLSGNPSSTHGPGRRAAAALAEARARIADALGARPSEVVFVRGGTESDNLAVLGRAALARADGRRPLVVHTAVEHSAVRDACRAVEADGGRRIELPLSGTGRPVDGELHAALAAEPDVLSVMWVNNETGTVLPVPDVAEQAAERGVALHTDAVQAVGKVRIRVDEVPVDLLTLTGHKIHGPRGMGILFVRDGVGLAPLIHGGGQERGLRPGTEDLAGAVGLAEAVVLAVQEREVTAGRLERLRSRLEDHVRERLPAISVHGADGPRAPHITNLGVPDVDQDLLLAALDMEGVAVSGGSACHSGASGGAGSSHVLRALHGEAVRGRAALRFSLGRKTTEEDVDRAAEVTETVVRRLQRG